MTGICRHGWQLVKPLPVRCTEMGLIGYHTLSRTHGQGRKSWVMGLEGLDPVKICRRGQYIVTLLPLKMSHSFIQNWNCCWITLQLHIVKDERLVWKLIFRGAYRLSGTGVVECLEIVDVRCNLKQLADWPYPHILRQIYATALGDENKCSETREDLKEMQKWQVLLQCRFLLLCIQRQ